MILCTYIPTSGNLNSDLARQPSPVVNSISFTNQHCPTRPVSLFLKLCTDMIGSAPKYLIDLIFVLPPSRYDLRRNNKGILLSTPKRFTKATMGDRSFMMAAPRLWNSLPISIRSACTTNDFKKKLKTFLFEKAFC